MADMSPCPVCHGTGKTVVNAFGRSGIHTQQCGVCIGTGNIPSHLAKHVLKNLDYTAQTMTTMIGEGMAKAKAPKFDQFTGEPLGAQDDLGLLKDITEDAGIGAIMAEVGKEFAGGVFQGGKKKLALKCSTATLKFAKTKLADRYPMLQLMGPVGDIIAVALVSFGMKVTLKKLGADLPSFFQPKLLTAFADLSLQGAALQFGEEGVEALAPIAKDFVAMAAGTLSTALTPGQMKVLSQEVTEDDG